jgi:hypothetical protein
VCFLFPVRSLCVAEAARFDTTGSYDGGDGSRVTLKISIGLGVTGRFDWNFKYMWRSDMLMRVSGFVERTQCLLGIKSVSRKHYHSVGCVS